MTVNTSQILTLGSRIPRIQVNNPEILSVTALSASEIQVAARNVGVTTINLWDEEGNIFTVDVTVLGDARELELALRTQFPDSSLNVYRYSNTLVLKGFVDRPDHVDKIMRLADDYAPEVINNITVGGVHEIMLRVKVMEVSRTKLRRAGFDFAHLSSGFVASAVSGVIAAASSGGVTTSGGETFSFGIVDGSDSFFGLLDALEQNNLMKILAEPVLTTVSGRPASFNVGGEFPVLVPQSLGTVSIDYKKFGTQVDFLPVVLGNGSVRLEVRPRVSEIDATRSVVINDITVPGLRVREIDTGVEMKAGQTLALAGLIQERVEAQFRGLPIVSKIPYLGAPFRRVEEAVNEIELLILVTPEFVDAMDPQQVPPCGPGTFTTSPSANELYMYGYLEVPACGVNGCGPAGAWPSASGGGPGGMAPPNGQTVPMFEQLPSGVDGNEPVLPDAGPNGSAAPPSAALPQENFGRVQRLPTASASSAPAAQYRQQRRPSYIRDNTYDGSDLPPEPIGPIGYDVHE